MSFQLFSTGLWKFFTPLDVYNKREKKKFNKTLASLLLVSAFGD